MNFNGLFQRTGRLGFGRLLILTYDLGDARPDASAPKLEGSKNDELEWQMQQISSRFDPIKLCDLLGHLGGKRPISGPHVCVTFESDSYHVREMISSMMTRFHVPATILLSLDQSADECSGLDLCPTLSIDSKALQELSLAGADIGYRASAGVARLASHQRRTYLSMLRKRVAKDTGTEPQVFAYLDRGDDERSKQLVHDAAISGFGLGVTDVAGINTLRPISPWSLKRNRVSAETTRAQFQTLLDTLSRGR